MEAPPTRSAAAWAATIVEPSAEEAEGIDRDAAPLHLEVQVRAGAAARAGRPDRGAAPCEAAAGPDPGSTRDARRARCTGRGGRGRRRCRSRRSRGRSRSARPCRRYGPQAQRTEHADVDARVAVATAPLAEAGRDRAAGGPRHLETRGAVRACRGRWWATTREASRTTSALRKGSVRVMGRAQRSLTARCHHPNGGDHPTRDRGTGRPARACLRSSKCRCVPVHEPVHPAWPIGSPASSHWPGTTAATDRCA